MTNEDSGDITVIDLARGEVAAKVPVGKRPRGIRVSPDEKLVFVALSGSPKSGPNVDESKLPPADRAADGIGVLDPSQWKLVRTLKSGQDPEHFDISRDGKTIFVSNEESGEASTVDVASGEVTGRIKVGDEPEGVTLRPDGKVVYVTSEVGNQIAALDVEGRKVVATIETGPRPRSLVFTSDGKTAFVACETGAEVTVIDAVKHRRRAEHQDRRARCAPHGHGHLPRWKNGLRQQRPRGQRQLDRRRHREARRDDRQCWHAALGHRRLLRRQKALYRQWSFQRYRRHRSRHEDGDQAHRRGAVTLGGRAHEMTARSWTT